MNQLPKPCGNCDKAQTLGLTIAQASQALVQGHQGVAAIYRGLAAGAKDPATKKQFEEAMMKHQKMAEQTATDIVVPTEGDI